MAELITLKNVGVCYQIKRSLRTYKASNQYWALKDINLVLKRGEVLGVRGKNGAGKSTLLKLLNGIISHDKGEVEINTKSTSLLSLQAGMIRELSGKNNAILSGMYLGLPKKKIMGLLDDIEKLADIGEFFDRPMYSYSTGMKARLGFAVAYYANPEVTLVDEVLSVGDQDFQKKSLALMKEKITSGATFIIVSHSENILKNYCTRIMTIKDGKSVYE